MKRLILILLCFTFPLNDVFAGKDTDMSGGNIRLDEEALNTLKNISEKPAGFEEFYDRLASMLQANQVLSFTADNTMSTTKAYGGAVKLMVLVDMALEVQPHTDDFTAFNEKMEATYKKIAQAIFTNLDLPEGDTISGFTIADNKRNAWRERFTRLMNAILYMRYQHYPQNADQEQKIGLQFYDSVNRLSPLIASWFDLQGRSMPAGEIDKKFGAFFPTATPEERGKGRAYTKFSASERNRISSDSTFESILRRNLRAADNSRNEVIGLIGGAIPEDMTIDDDLKAVFYRIRDALGGDKYPVKIITPLLGVLNVRPEYQALQDSNENSPEKLQQNYEKMNSLMRKIASLFDSTHNTNQVIEYGESAFFQHAKDLSQGDNYTLLRAFITHLESPQQNDMQASLNQASTGVRLSDDELIFLKSALDQVEPAYKDGMQSYVDQLYNTPSLGFTAAPFDENDNSRKNYSEGPEGSALAVMALLDVMLESDPQNPHALSLQRKVSALLFEGIPALIDSSDTLSGKMLRETNTATTWQEEKVFFTREEDLLIGTLRFRYGENQLSYATFKSAVNRIHRRILSWFGIERRPVHASFLEFVYKNMYGQPENVNLKSEFKKIINAAGEGATETAALKNNPDLKERTDLKERADTKGDQTVPTVSTDSQLFDGKPSSSMELNEDELNLGKPVISQSNSSIHLRNVLASKPALQGQQDGFTDAYMIPYLSKVIENEPIPPTTTLVGVIKTVEAEYAAKFPQDKTTYAYQWLLIPSRKNDPAEAAKSCVDRISASAYGQYFDKKWDYNSVVMVTQEARLGVRSEKKHLCGMIFSEIVE